MTTPENFYQEANQRLLSGGYSTNSLDQMRLPEVHTVLDGWGPEVSYAVFGDLSAPNIILQAASYATPLERPHFRTRLAAQQMALGDEYCMVGVQVFEPRKQGFDTFDRQDLTNGNFSALSARMLTVAEAISPQDDQKVFAYGYSLGGDTAMQTAYDSNFDENRGVVAIEAVGANEMVRNQQRGAIAVVAAMNTSGKKLFENIHSSKSPALLEAFGLTGDVSEKAKKRFDNEIGKGIARYVLSDLISNIALIRGFSHATGAEQAKELLDKTTIPVMLSRQEHSTLTSADFFADLKQNHNREGLLLLTEDGDHSDDDNLRRSIGRVLRFALHAGNL